MNPSCHNFEATMIRKKSDISIMAPENSMPQHTIYVELF
jgi:hypothetical protein